MSEDGPVYIRVWRELPKLSKSRFETLAAAFRLHLHFRLTSCFVSRWGYFDLFEYSYFQNESGTSLSESTENNLDRIRALFSGPWNIVGTNRCRISGICCSLRPKSRLFLGVGFIGDTLFVKRSFLYKIDLDGESIAWDWRIACLFLTSIPFDNCWFSESSSSMRCVWSSLLSLPRQLLESLVLYAELWAAIFLLQVSISSRRWTVFRCLKSIELRFFCARCAAFEIGSRAGA